jgi:hypothetical protein
LNYILKKILFTLCLVSAKIPLPKTAIGSLPTPTLGNIFSGPNDIGIHNYSSSYGEGNGIIYTCSAGHIDLAHVRSTADWTRYAYNFIKKELLKSSVKIPFKTSVDPSIFLIEVKYPNGWEDMSNNNKKIVVHLVAIKIAKYVIFNAANWHEILTWYGHSKVPFFSEYPSSFSWEDSFSNMMGIYLAEKVIQEKESDFNYNMTIAIRTEMESFRMLSRVEAISITNTLKGLWYSGWAPGLIKMKVRNFDIGQSDGYINPVKIKNIPECSEKIYPGYMVPTLEEANEHGFLFQVEIEPKEFAAKKILKVLHKKNGLEKLKIRPEIDLPILLNDMKKDALNKGYIYYE